MGMPSPDHVLQALTSDDAAKALEWKRFYLEHVDRNGDCALLGFALAGQTLQARGYDIVGE